jgi:ribosomal protein S16
MFSYINAVLLAIVSHKKRNGSNVDDIIEFIKNFFQNDSIRENYLRFVIKRMTKNGELIEKNGLYKLVTTAKKQQRKVVKAKKPYNNAHERSKFRYGKPNIPGIPVLSVGDDAQAAFYIKIEELFTKVPLAFMHAKHFEDLFQQMYAKTGNEKYNLYAVKFSWLSELSKLRNIRIAEKINIRLVKLGEKNSKSYRPIVTSGNYTDLLTESGNFIEALDLGINVDMYLDDTNDDAEVEGCTNDWCLDQTNDNGKASDSISLLIDKDGFIWTVLIIRGFAPGIGNLAIAGGFLDKKLNGTTESYIEGAKREQKEELNGVKFSIKAEKYKLNVKTITDWDFRPKFPGMTVGGLANVYNYRRC